MPLTLLLVSTSSPCMPADSACMERSGLRCWDGACKLIFENTVLHYEHANRENSQGKRIYTCCHTTQLPEDGRVQQAPACSPSCSRQWC